MDSNAKLILFLLLAVPPVLTPQIEDIDEDIQFHSRELDLIRNEIRDFQRRIRETSAREKSTLDKLEEIDEEISLVRNLLYRLKKEEKSKRETVVQMESEIEEKQRQYGDLKKRYARRVTNVYKKGRLSDIEILLDSDSWRQAIYRSKYLKIISDYDKTLGREIRETLQDISGKRASLNRELTDMEKIDREKSVRKKWLENRRRMRNRELAQLKRNRQEFSNAINERQKAARELESIITELERDKEKEARLAELERMRREEQLVGRVDFSLLKGKLPWPVKGKIVSHFGSHRNPTLKTVTENTGIDIKGPAGRQVRAVYDGIVTTVTYIRGYGNTVIIDHGDGFYTVYTHVTDVEVGENDYIKARDVIAHVGDSGSFDGAKLHFEIWGNRKKLDPEQWLRKS
ncbi:MAG: peptidoglycan DD-metalloendopeptidase family protein [Candidatus Neomarinimicrobiota bacterium]